MKYLILIADIDEFVIQMMQNYKEKGFSNISSENLNLDSEEEKENLKKINEDNKDIWKSYENIEKGGRKWIKEPILQLI